MESLFESSRKYAFKYNVVSKNKRYKENQQDFKIVLSNLNNFHSLEVVNRVSMVCKAHHLKNHVTSAVFSFVVTLTGFII